MALRNPATVFTTTTASALDADLFAAADVSQYKFISLQLSGTWSGSISVQVSNDNITWYKAYGDIFHGGGQYGAQTDFIQNEIALVPIKARYMRIRMLSYTSGTASASLIGYTDERFPNFASVNVMSWITLGAGSNTIGSVYTLPTRRPTYRASTTAVLVAAVTSPNPFFTIYGSATKTIRIQSILVSGLTLTAVAYLNIGLKKYSTAVSGGTSTALTQVPLDANSAAGTATNVNAYTAIPTAGTAVGNLTARRVLGQATTAAAAGIPNMIDFDFTPVGDGEAIVLRDTAQGVGLYWIVAPATTVSMVLRVEWTEE